MSANVRCAGKGWHEKDGQIRLGYACGWKGERHPFVHGNVGPMDIVAAFARRATAKPCPRCGGRVELLYTERAVGRLLDELMERIS